MDDVLFRDSPLHVFCRASSLDYHDVSFYIRDGIWRETRLHDLFVEHAMPDGFVEEITSTPILGG